MKLQLKRTACVMLAVVMLTGVFPVSASASGFISPPLNGATGSGWDNFNSSANEIIFGSNPVTLSLGPRFSPSDEPITPDIDFSDGEDISLADDNEDTGSEEADDPFDVEPSIATGESKTVNCQLSTINCQDMPVDLAAALLAYIEGANMAMASRPLFIPAAAPGDIGTIQFSNQPIDLPIDVNYWPVINWVNRPGQAKTPFCAQFGPNPQEGVPYAASAYNDDFVLRLLVAYEESIVSDRLAVQVAIWGHIHGWSSWMQWGPAATAINASGGVNLTGWKLLRFAGPTGAQPLFAAVFNEGPPTPPVDGEGEFRVEWRYDQVAETTFAREATTEVTDARGQLTIRKQNQNHEPLDGALFNIRIDFSDGTHQQIDGWETYNGGRLLTWNHPPGNIDPAIVTITEVRAPQHYSINADNQRVVTVSPSYTLWEHVQFWEETMTTTTAWWVVLRITEDGDEVEVDRWQDGPVSHERNRSPWNRHSTADSVVGDLHQSVTFINQRISGQLIVYKRCAVTGQLLQGAEFRVEGVDLGNTGTYNQTGVTGPDGSVTFNSLFPGTYMVTEVRAPHTHNTDAPPQTTAIQSNETVRLTFENTRRQGLNILKVDPDGNPLQGAVFEVRRGSGQVLGSYITDVNGLIIIPSHYLTTGYYLAEEIQAPDGFIIDRENNPQTIWIDNSQQNQTYSLVFRNFRMPSLEIIKVDTNDGRPLLGAAFRITEANGRFVGEHTTGPDGLITLTGLPPGVYTVSEIRAADGYILDLTPQIVTLEAGKTHRLEFRNTAIPGLQLIKLCSETGRPVEGAIFDVVELQGGFRKSLGTFTTGANGTFFIPGLSLGHYVTTEVKAAPGYILDPAPQNIFVQGGRINVVTVYNTPYSNLRLLKICSETRDPLEGAVFRLFDDKRRELGTFTTSVLGEIHLTQLPGGTYFIQEVRAPAGYLLDNTVRQIELIGGKTTIVEVPNKELGSLRIIKRCAEDGRPLYGATFLLYDTRNNLLGEFRTDQNGSIVFGSNLAAGTYRIREIRAPEGYVLDETLRTVTVREGETTEIVVENAPIRGRIQIVKKAADDNPITRQRAGALLEGAEFEIYDRNLNVVDTITTDINGIAISINLPLGTYAVRETKSPTGFFTDGAVFYAEIKIHNDMVRFEVLNQSKDLSVMVEKRGNVEVIAGDEMKYDFSNIANTSNVPLYNFYWHDQLPADSVRLGTIHTGTWSESLTYNVTYRTNLRTSYRPLASNLSSRTSHTLDATPAALRLAANEYITDIRFEFGTVSPGFREVEAPSFIVNTLANIPNGHRIVNRTEVGGRDGGAEVTARDQWVTISLSKPKGALPRTGW